MAESHYDEKYWAFQKEIGKIGGLLNKFKFNYVIKPDLAVLDFGCGGGYLLSNYTCAKKIGVEINPSARTVAAESGIETYASIQEVPSEYVDVIISNHAMEHVENPLEILKHLYRALKPGGTIVIVVPCEQYTETAYHYKENDINNHLFTWCPMTLGNLSKAAGFKVMESVDFQHQWIPNYATEYMKPDFDKRCMDHAKKNGNRQLRLRAKKPSKNPDL